MTELVVNAMVAVVYSLFLNSLSCTLLILNMSHRFQFEIENFCLLETYAKAYVAKLNNLE